MFELSREVDCSFLFWELEVVSEPLEVESWVPLDELEEPLELDEDCEPLEPDPPDLEFVLLFEDPEFQELVDEELEPLPELLELLCPLLELLLLLLPPPPLEPELEPLLCRPSLRNLGESARE